MDTAPTTFKELICSWGIAKFAADMGVPYSTANALQQRNSLPVKYWPLVTELAPKAMRLSYDRLVQMEVESRVSA